MSTFQNENKNVILLERLIELYTKKFLSNPDRVTQRVNPTGSQDETTRRDESETKIVKFEELTMNRTRKVLLKKIHQILDEMEGTK